MSCLMRLRPDAINYLRRCAIWISVICRIPVHLALIKYEIIFAIERARRERIRPSRGKLASERAGTGVRKSNSVRLNYNETSSANGDALDIKTFARARNSITTIA